MQFEFTENFADQEDPAAGFDSAPSDDEAPPLENENTNGPAETPEAWVHQHVRDSRVGILNALTGSYSTAISISNQFGPTGKIEPILDAFVSFSRLEPPSRTYKSVDASMLVGHSGGLQSERILLLSCYDEDVRLNLAKSIAYETKIASKELVSVDEKIANQAHYNFRSLIHSLSRPEKKRKTSSSQSAALCVWDPNEADEIAGAMLDSLLSRNTQVENYKYSLAERGLFLICLVSPQRVKEYNELHTASLRTLEIDFLAPLLEQYELNDYETLAATIRQQRVEGYWSDTDAEFYKQIIRQLKEGTLSDAVQNNATTNTPNSLKVEDLFNRQDPLVETVLYCATYFPNLSPPDFIALVELFLSERTEQVTRRQIRPDEGDGSGPTEVLESVSLGNRWRQDAASILAQCKLATLRNEDDKRVIDFQIDGLRDRLSQFLSTQLCYDLNFVLVRKKGLLLNPKKGIADGARKLLVAIGKESAASEVAYWLYEIVAEFDELADDDDESVSRYDLLPNLTIKVARRYVSFGLSKLLMKCENEPALRDAVRLFWQKLLHNQHQWFLDLLRRMGDSAPTDSLKWLKQLLDQGAEAIRKQAQSYLVNHLLHRDAIYPALRELMQWPIDTQAGRIARQVLVLYCAETNRQIMQEEYGRWPTSHPLFAFESRAEAKECLDFLVGSIYAGASELDAEKALYIVADIVAAWYFILSPPSSEVTPEFASESNYSELNPGVVKDLIFECLMRHSPRAQRNALVEIWDRLKNDLLNAVIEVDKITASSTDAASLPDAAKARRELLDTRALLTELRNAFVESVATAASA